MPYHADQFTCISEGGVRIRTEMTNSAIIEAKDAKEAWDKALDKFNEGK